MAAAAKQIDLSAVPEPLKVANACLPALRDLIRNANLGFTKTLRARNSVHFELTGAGQRTAVARDSYAVHPFLESAKDIYWVAVLLDFRFAASTHRLTSAGLIIFRGLANDDMKEPVLRAEWHCDPIDMSAGHAQPHWHVYQLPERTARTKFDAEETKSFGTKPPVESTATQTQSFHFAMYADWQNGTTGCHAREIGNVQNLVSWIDGCLSYISAELKAT
jgi:hypothetical protein